MASRQALEMPQQEGPEASMLTNTKPLETFWGKNLLEWRKANYGD